MSARPSFSSSPVVARALRRRLRPHRFDAAAPLDCALQSLEPRLLMSAVVDQDDHESGLHVLPAMNAPIESAASAESSASLIPALDLANTFNLSSLPGANQTIYLDFTGHVTSGTIWNSNFTSGSNFTTPAYDFDGNTASFSDAELERIYYIWARVVEDFAPFAVNVTTLEPAAGDLIKSGAGDTRWGVRVVIGGSSFDWFKSGAGGVAYVGSFNWNSDTPTYVFDEQLGDGHEKYTAEAISHEAGHTLGLSHDGRNSPNEGYYEGHGSGATGWAPLMGVGYYQNLTQWSKGEYLSANNKEDDLAIITTQNGFGYRADDYGNTVASAAAIDVDVAAASASGLIERNTDLDVFSFASGTGVISLSINPAARGANLDILAELLDSSGNVVASSNPADALSASINTTVAGGNYFLRISGVGKGDPLSGGYSDYGSLGQYFVTGSIVPTGPVLTISDVTVNEGAGIAVFTVALSQTLATDVTFDATTADGSALAGADYNTTTALGVTIAAGATSATVTVPIIDNATSEGAESFTLNLSNAVGAAILDGQAAGTIIDDDITVSISDASTTETNPNKNGSLKTTDLTFTVTLSAAAGGTVAVQYTTANGSAVAGSDYTTATGTLTFNPGETSKTIIIKAIGDTLQESTETVFLNLTGATGVTIANGTGVGSIIDNDAPKGRGNRADVAEGATAGHDFTSLLASLAPQSNGKAARAVGKTAINVLAQTPAQSILLDVFDGSSEG